MDTPHDTLNSFAKLLKIMGELREGCPWDRKQTMESLRHLTLEEVHELSDAVLSEDTSEIKKELGDVLLHIVFYARIAEEQKAFDIKAVIDSLCEKLIHRHPHIYGDVKVENEEEVKQNWERIKQKESGAKKSILSGVPSSLPALVKALRMQDKAAQVGFDWSEKSDVWNKVEEELSEFQAAQTTAHKEEEFGDLLFALVNYARFEGINPDDALEKANRKFKRRFEFIEAQAQTDSRSMESMSLDEMENLWNQAKLEERK